LIVSCYTSDAPCRYTRETLVIGRLLAGLKIEDLAKALGKQSGAVRVSQFRALRALAEHLGPSRGPGRKGKGERP
jgi:DNA-directed RNA polymerase specialized sigma24 family protein